MASICCKLKMPLAFKIMQKDCLAKFMIGAPGVPISSTQSSVKISRSYDFLFTLEI